MFMQNQAPSYVFSKQNDVVMHTLGATWLVSYGWAA